VISFPGVLTIPLVAGLAVGLIMAFLRLHPALVFVSTWATFIMVAPRGSAGAPPMPIPLLTSGFGMVILLLICLLFLVVALLSFNLRLKNHQIGAKT